MVKQIQLAGCSISPKLESLGYTPNLNRLAETPNRFMVSSTRNSLGKTTIQVFTDTVLQRFTERALKVDGNFVLRGLKSLKSFDNIRALPAYTFITYSKSKELFVRGGGASSSYTTLLFDSISDMNEYLKKLTANMTVLADRKTVTFETSGMKSAVMYEKLKLDNSEVLPISVQVNTRAAFSIADLKSTKEVPVMNELYKLTFLKSTGRVVQILDTSSMPENARTPYLIATHLKSIKKGTIELHDDTLVIKMDRVSETTLDILVDTIYLKFANAEDSYEYMKALAPNILELKF